MRILAIDTSTSVMGIALLDENKVYAEHLTNLKKNHSISLMPHVDKLFEEINWSPNDIELIAVAKGPGSYTGVRIGVTTGKTLSWALNIPLVGVSTLESMAYQHRDFNGLLSPILDARRGQVYTALYQQKDDKWGPKEQDIIILFSKWVDMLSEYNENILFIGDDIQLHIENINEIGTKAQTSLPPNNIPRPSIIGWLAKEKYDKGNIDDAFDFAPAYLQLAEAEAKWLEKQKL